MLLQAILLAALALRQTAGEEGKDASAADEAGATVEGIAGGAVERAAASAMEGKDLGYGSDNYNDYSRKVYIRIPGGRSFIGYGLQGQQVQQGQQGQPLRQQLGGYYGNLRVPYQNAHILAPKLVPLKMPYMDKNGCRFPGDVVCDPANDPNGYLLCVLDTENKNLWKKPTLGALAIACPTATFNGMAGVQTHVVNDFCNNNKRIMQAVGFIQEKDQTKHNYFHQGTFAVDLNPCIVVN